MAAPTRGATRRRRVLAVLALLVLLTGAAVVVLAIVDHDGTRDQSSGEPPATVETPTAETSAPPTTAPETTPAPEVVTTPETTRRPRWSRPRRRRAPAPPHRHLTGRCRWSRPVRDYYALMDAGRIDEGFARLSPAYQERTGESSYRGFWQTIDRVEVLDA